MPGQAKGVKHMIITLRGELVREKWRRIPFHQYRTIKEKLDKMLAQDIIIESRSPWCSPLMVVPKPDRILQLCIESQRLNGFSQFNMFLMPRISKLFECIDQAKFSSTLDLSKGYWQIPLPKRPLEYQGRAFQV